MDTPRLFILGAGASYAAGLPMADTVLANLFQWCVGPTPYLATNRTPMQLLQTVAAIVQETMRAQLGRGEHQRFPLDTLFERLYAELLVNPSRASHLERLFGTLAEFLYVLSCRGVETYCNFARALRENDVVVTFNWDICLELSLWLEKRVFSRRHDARGVDGPLILKPHGSVDDMIFEVASFAHSIVGLPSAPDGTHVPQALHWILEPLRASPPPVRQGEFICVTELCRLRTYDCPQVVSATWDFEQKRLDLNLHDRSSITIDGASPDVGAFQLFERVGTTSQKLANTRFLQAPGAPQQLYDWSYRQAIDTVTRCAAKCNHVYVCGYSFPSYDSGVQKMIATMVQQLGLPPATIVNPAANQIPASVLKQIFGDNYRLREEGFEAFSWD